MLEVIPLGADEGVSAGPVPVLFGKRWRFGDRIAEASPSRALPGSSGRGNGEVGSTSSAIPVLLCLCPRPAAAWPQEAAMIGPVSSCLRPSLGAGWAPGRTSNLLVRRHVMLPKFGSPNCRSEQDFALPPAEE